MRAAMRLRGDGKKSPNFMVRGLLCRAAFLFDKLPEISPAHVKCMRGDI
jgi:hypothetical protein